MGDVWHYHPEVELALFTEGEGIRYIGDSVQSFNAPDLVLSKKLMGNDNTFFCTCARNSEIKYCACIANNLVNKKDVMA